MNEPEAENADPACDPFSAFGPLIGDIGQVDCGDQFGPSMKRNPTYRELAKASELS